MVQLTDRPRAASCHSGALSPRLVDVAASVRPIRGLVLSPCCLKGALGSMITRQAKLRGLPAYTLAVRTMAALCESEVRVQRQPGQRESGLLGQQEQGAAAPEPAAAGGAEGSASTVASAAAATALAPASAPASASVSPAVSAPTEAAPTEAAPAAAVPASERTVATTRIFFDEHVLSPKNGFIVCNIP